MFIGDRYTIADLDSIKSINAEMQELQEEGAKLKTLETEDPANMYGGRGKSQARRGRRAGVDLEAALNHQASRFNSVDANFKDGDKFDLNGVPIKTRERHIGKAHMKILITDHAANFATHEEEDYLNELLQTRALGLPHWTDQLEGQFRDQLLVSTNVQKATDGLTTSAMQRLLDKVQVGYIVGFAEDRNAMKLCDKAAEKALRAMESENGVIFDDDDARLTVLNRLVRKAEDPPY